MNLFGLIARARGGAIVQFELRTPCLLSARGATDCLLESNILVTHPKKNRHSSCRGISSRERSV